MGKESDQPTIAEWVNEHTTWKRHDADSSKADDNGNVWRVGFRAGYDTWSAVVRWDGCVDLYASFNGPIDGVHPSIMVDELHLCELDQTIQLLQDLKAKALEAFGKDWPCDGPAIKGT